jgi:hypothetical protein
MPPKRKWKAPRPKVENDGKMPLVVYGNGMLNSNLPFHRHKSNPSNKVYKNLKRRERDGQVAVALIDEYLTSQVSWQKLRNRSDVCINGVVRYATIAKKEH